ncbi:hypothetical protein V8E36_007480 [Tilletia maclaganii]
MRFTRPTNKSWPPRTSRSTSFVGSALRTRFSSRTNAPNSSDTKPCLRQPARWSRPGRDSDPSAETTSRSPRSFPPFLSRPTWFPQSLSRPSPSRPCLCPRPRPARSAPHPPPRPATSSASSWPPSVPCSRSSVNSSRRCRPSRHWLHLRAGIVHCRWAQDKGQAILRTLNFLHLRLQRRVLGHQYHPAHSMLLSTFNIKRQAAKAGDALEHLDFLFNKGSTLFQFPSRAHHHTRPRFI